jgi:hypothetical protein
MSCDYQYMEDLFGEIRGLSRSTIVQVDSKIVNHPKLIEQMGKANVRMAFIGLETVNDQTIIFEKGFGNISQYEKLISMLRANNIEPIISLIVGFESDTVEIFDRIKNFLERNHIGHFFIWILWPVMGSKILNMLELNDRMLVGNTEVKIGNGQGIRCIYQPASMTYPELGNGYWTLYSDLYSYRSIFKRLFSAYWNRPRDMLTTLGANLSAKRLVKQYIHPMDV